MHLATSRQQQLPSTAKGLLYANFNNDGSYFAIGTTTGFQLFRSNPFRLLLKRERNPLLLGSLESAKLNAATDNDSSLTTTALSSLPFSTETTAKSEPLASIDSSLFEDLEVIHDVPLGPDDACIPSSIPAASLSTTTNHSNQTGLKNNPTGEIKQLGMDQKPGGIAIVALHYSTNLMALVGGGRVPKYPPNVVVLWDDWTQRIVAEIEMSVEIKDVRLRKDRIIIILATKVFVFSLEPSPHKMHEYECSWNNHPILGISSSTEMPVVLAFPARSKGQIQIVEIPVGSNSALHSSKPVPLTGIIAAHSTQIACLAVSGQGSLVASASERGTLIRIFDCRTSTLLNELRRGVDYAEIYSIVFNSVSTRICVASDKGTLHIFNLSGDGEMASNPKSDDSNSEVLGSVIPNLGYNQTKMNNHDGSGFKLDSSQRSSVCLPSTSSSQSGNSQVFQRTRIATEPSQMHEFFRSNDISISHRSINTQPIPYSDSAAPSISPSVSRSATGYQSTSTGANRHSILSPISSYLPKYFSSDWSFAHCTLPVECRCTVSFSHVPIMFEMFPASTNQSEIDLLGGFSQHQSSAHHKQPSAISDRENAVIALCSNGGYFLFSFEPKKGGECAREAFYRFYKEP